VASRLREAGTMEVHAMERKQSSVEHSSTRLNTLHEVNITRLQNTVVHSN